MFLPFVVKAYKAQWKLLKENFKRERAAEMKNSSGQAATGTRLWSIYQAMQFIEPFLKRRK